MKKVFQSWICALRTVMLSLFSLALPVAANDNNAVPDAYEYFSASVWVAAAILQLINRPVPANAKIYVNCNVYPPNSYEGARCRAGK